VGGALPGVGGKWERCTPLTGLTQGDVFVDNSVVTLATATD
jgi:hypothetical protein